MFRRGLETKLDVSGVMEKKREVSGGIRDETRGFGRDWRRNAMFRSGLKTKREVAVGIEDETRGLGRTFVQIRDNPARFRPKP
jgi:hypothetical protein